MKIWSKSKIGSDGIQRIIVEIKPARLNSFDLFEGGEYINFEIDHKKQRTSLWQMSFRNGVPRFEEKALKVYKGEIIDSDKECLEIVKKIKAV